jgi:hypothetical protein
MGFKDLLSRAAKTLERAREGAPEYKTFEITGETFEKIIRVVENRSVEEGVLPRGDELTPLDVVGESFYQEDIAKLSKGQPGDKCGWFSGLLISEPRNEYDPNAVAVYLIDSSLPEIEAFQVGYLPKEVAAKVTDAISKKLLEDGQVVPILARLTGGEVLGKPNYGVVAKAFWNFK